MNEHNSTLMKEYQDNYAQYEALEKIAYGQLHNALKDSGVMVFQTSNRLKTQKSLAGKLEKKGDKYKTILDITDLLGMRIICYFSDDVDRIAELIERLFVIDTLNSVDKRKMLDDDEFGYMSLHFICSLTPEQTEDEGLRRIRFEIQIRSILQHAWAEINHDIGYKNTSGVPHWIVREFSRVAGLLEIADEEFMHIRDSSKNYHRDVAQKVTSDNAQTVPVNETSLEAFFENSSVMKKLCSSLGLSVMIRDVDEREDSEDTEGSLERIEAAGIATLGELSAVIEQNMDRIKELVTLEYTDQREEDENTEPVIQAESLIRIIIEAMLIDSADPETEVREYMRRYYKDPDEADDRAKELLKNFKRISKGKHPKKADD